MEVQHVRLSLDVRRDNIRSLQWYPVALAHAVSSSNDHMLHIMEHCLAVQVHTRHVMHLALHENVICTLAKFLYSWTCNPFKLAQHYATVPMLYGKPPPGKPHGACWVQRWEQAHFHRRSIGQQIADTTTRDGAEALHHKLLTRSSSTVTRPTHTRTYQTLQFLRTIVRRRDPRDPREHACRPSAAVQCSDCG